MKGVVLAAGKGTRLYPVTRRIPKALLPLANRPMLEYVFDRLKEIDVREVCIVVGENRAAIEGALGSGRQFGLELSYAVQPEPKGLAHALGFAKSHVGGDDFVLYLGDGYYDRDFSAEAAIFREGRAQCVSLVKRVDDPRRFGVATVEDGRITKLVEKPERPESNFAMAGVYFFRPSIWEAIDGLEPSARGEYEITDAIQRLIDRGALVEAADFEGGWFDTGTLDSYLACVRSILAGESLADPGALCAGRVGASTVLGSACTVRCASIENSTVLAGAKIEVEGAVRGCLLGGEVRLAGDLENAVKFGGEAA
jgi:glucose-1-phosphate thymidylyltransferase